MARERIQYPYTSIISIAEHSMVSRALHALMISIRPSNTTRTTYDHTPSAETTELQTLTRGSNGNVNFDNPFAARKATSEKASSITHVNELSSFQYYKQRFSGRRVGVLNFAVCASVVFMINFIVTIWGSVRHQKCEGVLSEGSCERI
jgi:hypothetical protein